MRRRARSVPKPVLAGLLVFLMAFGFYSATTSGLVGYEPETGAITEGLVVQGHFWDIQDPVLPSLESGTPGKGGHLYARTGLLQPLLEAPFFAAGHFIDGHFGWTEPNPYRLVFLWFYNPFVASLAAVALFALVFQTRKSLGWAAAIAALFVFASIAWPYAKIGMETTFMFAVLAAFAFAVWARRKPTVFSWAVTGLVSGAIAATKPYAGIALLAIAVLLWPTLRAQEPLRRVRLASAALLPVLLWLAAICFYNWTRFGSLTNFGGGTPTEVGGGTAGSPLTIDAPFNVLGLLFSPGKGLILYSPLVILGALGLPRLWRDDRQFAAALLTLFIVLTCVAGTTEYWGDEVWGPRYLVPVAWTLLVPIAWWASTLTRQRILTAFAALAFVVQLIGASAYYGGYPTVVAKLTGVPIYQDRAGVNPQRIPYGVDPTRWIPQLSALVLQTEGLISSQVLEPLGAGGLEVAYAPYEGRARTIDFSDPELHTELDYFWSTLLPTLGARIFAALMFVFSLASGFLLYRLARGKRTAAMPVP
jgi:hypothetical protein